MSVIIREVDIEDWEMLEPFYRRIYRKNHPLQSREFWNWQFGDVNHGRAFACINEDNKVVGHVGANFKAEIAWMINGYLDPEYRGQGIMRKLYSLARNYYPLAATAANVFGLSMYRNMRWIRYYDLTRYVKINPNLQRKEFEDVCKKIEVKVDHLIVKKNHYQIQPNQNVIELSGKSTAISQESVGGLRVIDLESLDELEEHAWNLGYLWMDYITSWNDLKSKLLEKNNWKLDYKSIVPWRLNPVEKDYFCDITFLSEYPIDREFIVHRSYSDHGRVGSI